MERKPNKIWNIFFTPTRKIRITTRIKPEYLKTQRAEGEKRYRKVVLGWRRKT